MKNLIFALAIIAAVVYFSGCESITIQPPKEIPTPPDTSTVDTIVYKFSTDVYPLFPKNNCNMCHPSSHKPDFSSQALSYTSLKTGGYVDTPAITSKLMVRLNISPAHNGTNKFTTAEKLKISKWIKQGAKNN